MTEYEKLVKEGKMVPMNGMDSLMIQMTVEPLVNGETELDEEMKEILELLMVEIEHLYQDDQELLTKLKTILHG